MNDSNSDFHITEGLNIDSADEMGLEWWKDVIYDEEAPIESMQDILDLANEGYFFGSCVSASGNNNNLVGVYKKKPAV